MPIFLNSKTGGLYKQCCVYGLCGPPTKSFSRPLPCLSHLHIVFFSVLQTCLWPLPIVGTAGP